MKRMTSNKEVLIQRGNMVVKSRPVKFTKVKYAGNHRFNYYFLRWLPASDARNQ